MVDTHNETSSRTNRRADMVSEFTSLQWRLARASRAAVTAALGESSTKVSEVLTSVTPVQRGILMALAEDGPLAMGELARRLAITPSSATDVVDRLVEHGWVERVTSPADRRTVSVQLTPSAAELAARVKAAVTAGVQSTLAGLDDDELATLVGLLSRMVPDSPAAGRKAASLRPIVGTGSDPAGALS
jgi:DNA-binding MarR family transcriptional regulator